MAKDVKANGSNVPPSYLNAINGIDGSTGIVLDGVDDNGHGPKLIADSHVNPSTVFPDVNLFVSATLATNVSFDAGSTFGGVINWTISRVGNSVTMKLKDIITGTITGGDAPIHVRPNGGGTWDSAFFGTADFFSTMGVVEEATSFEAGWIRFIDTSTTLRIAPTSVNATFGNGNVASISFDSNFHWIKE